MCVACALPKGTTLTEKEFDNCWENNPDGGGYCYIGEGGILVVKKSLAYDDFKKMYARDYERRKDYSPFLLHFRIKSVGEVSLDNCHPFKINPKLAMIHNGTISKVKPENNQSDTAHFAEMLGLLPHNFLNNTTIVQMIGDYIGMNNKLAFLDSAGAFSIFNKVGGVTDKERWFSNNSFGYGKPAPSEQVNTYMGSGYQQKQFPITKYSTPTSMRECAFCLTLVPYKDFNIQLAGGICDVCKADMKLFGDRAGIYQPEYEKLIQKLYKDHELKRPRLVSSVGTFKGILPTTNHYGWGDDISKMDDEEYKHWEMSMVGGYGT